VLFHANTQVGQLPDPFGRDDHIPVVVGVVSVYLGLSQSVTNIIEPLTCIGLRPMGRWLA